jgi:hypothetical protein
VLGLRGFAEVRADDLRIAGQAGRLELRTVLPPRRVPDRPFEVRRIFDRDVVHKVAPIGVDRKTLDEVLALADGSPNLMRPARN